jgi:hypothetical protein
VLPQPAASLHAAFLRPLTATHTLLLFEPTAQAGEITSPSKRELFYLSQRPYLVVGSLRDQLLYPKPPARVWAGSAAEDRRRFVQLAGEEPQYTNRDAGEGVGRCFGA